MIKSLDELRKYVCSHTHEDVYGPSNDFDNSARPWDVLTIADAIEHEVESNYIELPEDADGDVWRVGDLVVGEVNPNNPKRVERMLWYGPDSGWQLETDNIIYPYPERSRHHKPPTVEDVLREFAKSIADMLGGDEFLLRDDDEMYAEFAERLQLREAE